MINRNLLFLTLALVLLSSGCISQTYRQTVLPDGTSYIENRINFTNLPQYYDRLGGLTGATSEEMFRANITASLPAACERIAKKDKSTECTADGLMLTLKRNFSSAEGYYTLEISEGVPYRTYKLTVVKVPADRFSKAAAELGKMAPEAENALSLSNMRSIDLRKKEDNAVSGQGFELLGAKMYYTVVMPGEITGASAGEYSADVSGSEATFDLVKVMGNSAPLVVESREINVLMIGLAVGAILLIGLAVSFFWYRKH